MSWWRPSWPSFPNFDFALPSNLQRRFISFLLKRSLGPFLKPGQLDVEQIDSQIGSGYLQVKDLEIDENAVNTLLSGVPLELREGSIGTITARVPWPNPMSGNIRLSLSSLHLVLEVTSRPSEQPTSPVDLAESVVSVAETFVHDEMSVREEEVLMNSIHEEMGMSDDNVVPGGLDPFGSPEDRAHSSHSTGDPDGVSLFAGLLQRLLLRFEMDVEDAQITIVHPGHSEFTFTLAELQFNHQSFGEVPTDAALQSPVVPEDVRIIRFSGLSVLCRNLDTDHPAFSEHSPTQSHAASASDSDYDEASQLLMSQSFAALPPRNARLQESVEIDSSALFQSAMSTLPEVPEPEPGSQSTDSSSSNPPRSPPPSTHIPEASPADILCSMSAEPFVIRITLRIPTSSPAPSADSPVDPSYSLPPARSVSVAASMGPLAFAVRPWHVAAVLELGDAFSPSSSGTSRPRPAMATSPSILEKTTSYLDEVDISVRIRAIVLLVLPSGKSVVRNSSFFERPLQPPTLPCGYARLYVDTITASLRGTTRTSVSYTSPAMSPVRLGPHNDGAPALQMHAQLSVSDLSILAFSAPSPDIPEHRVLPILITDPTLPEQYSEEHNAPPSLSEGLPLRRRASDLPSIPSHNWLSSSHRTTQARISHWRSKPTARNRHSFRSSADTARVVPTSPQSISPSPQFASPSSARDTASRSAPAIDVHFDSGRESGRSTPSAARIVVDLAPLHVFVEVESLVQGKHPGEPSAVMKFVQDFTVRKYRLISGREQHADVESRHDLPRPPVAHMGRVQTFEQHALDGLGLTMDYGLPVPREAPPTAQPENKPQVSLHAPLIRIEARASSQTRRSGTILVDLHALSLDSSSPQETGLHFASEDAQTLASDDSHLVSVEWRRAVVAISPPSQDIAAAFVSIGPLVPESMSRNRQSRLPRVSVGSSALRSTLVVLHVPSVHADLTKESFDGLQLWADDVANVMERASATPPASFVDQSTQGVRDPSLIGSRYFLQQKRGSQDSGRSADRAQVQPKGGQTVVKVFVAEAFARLRLVREDDGGMKPLDILASDLDVLLEIKPDGKDENVCTMGIMNVAVLDQGSTSPLPVLSLTAPRGFANTSRQFLHLRFKSSVVAGSSAKESQIAVTLSGFTYNFVPDLGWIDSLAKFVKPPAGVFEGVPPSEQTFITVHVRDGSVRLFALNHPGAFLMHVGELDFATVLTSDNPNLNCEVSVPSLSALMADDFAALTDQLSGKDLRAYRGVKYWQKSKYALIAEILNANVAVDRSAGPPAKLNATVDGIEVRVHLCADTGAALGAFFTDLASAFKTDEPMIEEAVAPASRVPEDVSVAPKVARSQELMHSVDEAAFRTAPEVGAAPDMIADDLPVNMDYLDESFGAAAGLRELTEDDMDEFDATYTPDIDANDPSIISRVGGETIRLLEPEGIDVVENHFNTLPAITEELPQTAEILDCVKLQKAELTLFLYDGYDLTSTRRTIEHEMKEMKKRLAKIRQLVSEGQKYDPSASEIEPSALLFNSFYVGLKEDAEGMEGEALIGAIDEVLEEGFEGEMEAETGTQSSWQSLPAKPRQRRVSAQLPTAQTSKAGKGRRLTRASAPSVEFKLQGANVEYDRYADEEDLASRVFATIREVEIYDHCKTSTWRKFLSALRMDSRGNIRETGSNMVRVEVQNIRPVPGNTTEEVRLRAKLLPLRLHVDQDALDFLKKFFSFKDPNAVPSDAAPTKEAYLQRAEVFPVGLTLDYKPRRVDYRALREGKTIELMNFFHFDGAEMTLRHITLYGVTGWPRFFDMLNDLWTPDVKATQLADVISGVAPIRSVVNVGSGVADLVLLPIAQYRKDGRVVRGVQKGTKAFVQSTAMEAVKLGARLATGTQVILEQAENVLGSRQFEEGETILIRDEDDEEGGQSVGDLEDALREQDPISRYAEQPGDLQEGMQAAYAGMRRNLNSAAQTILAVPMEVYERSGNEGAVRAVIRAVPIAVLRPMIGASEAVSKALLGLQNSMDPNVRLENEAKYKHRA
ncbi:hypothetical protein PENSPDRAFT_481043 [Peniophora sp. CONT]|nr:hypothetical protein PENSPDRAFT_481043 [Peniophora sp. CONT]